MQRHVLQAVCRPGFPATSSLPRILFQTTACARTRAATRATRGNRTARAAPARLERMPAASSGWPPIAPVAAASVRQCSVPVHAARSAAPFRVIVSCTPSRRDRASRAASRDVFVCVNRRADATPGCDRHATADATGDSTGDAIPRDAMTTALPHAIQDAASNGGTPPNPNRQAALVERALAA
ncbi:hypothetical protein [Burkholderia sp. Bp8963]|uniref:hypothetical protein n=1 Tax=Burkholderia sp. Bp8963 TaxID=2184547 RepID=UPI000F5A3E53|nr:hypothetical protein [Burkholderia sp. Bp8963]